MKKERSLSFRKPDSTIKNTLKNYFLSLIII